jgi:hypothetical protein
MLRLFAVPKNPALALWLAAGCFAVIGAIDIGYSLRGLVPEFIPGPHFPAPIDRLAGRSVVDLVGVAQLIAALGLSFRQAWAWWWALGFLIAWAAVTLLALMVVLPFTAFWNPNDLPRLVFWTWVMALIYAWVFLTLRRDDVRTILVGRP